MKHLEMEAQTGPRTLGYSREGHSTFATEKKRDGILYSNVD